MILSVVAFIAGKPVTVQCDQNLGGLAAATGVVAVAPFGGNVIYATPRICDSTRRAVGDEQFAISIATFIHEAAHSRGYRVEGCAEMIADVGVYQVLRDFYGVPFFTPTSVLVGRQVRDTTRLSPAAYQIESCWKSAAPG